MNSRELRIGNYVEVDHVIAEVVAIYNNEHDIAILVLPNKVIKINAEKAVPVALSIDFLIRHCNFDHNGRHILGMDHHRYFLRFHKGYILLSDRKDEPIIHFWDIRHLHQLQNLYHALKGREIEIVFNNDETKTK